MIQTKECQLVFLLPFHPSLRNTKGRNNIGSHKLLTGNPAKDVWELRWGASGAVELDNVAQKKRSIQQERSILNPSTEKSLRKTLRIWELRPQNQLPPGIAALQLGRSHSWSIILPDKKEETQITPGWIRIVDTTQDIAFVAIQFKIRSISMTEALVVQRQLSKSVDRDRGWHSEKPLVIREENDRIMSGLLYLSRKTSKDSETKRYKTTVFRLLKAIANDVLQQSNPQEEVKPRVFHKTLLGYHSVVCDNYSSESWPGIDLKLEHNGFRIMKEASPTWGRYDNGNYSCDDPQNRHSFWANHDAILLCITGNSPYALHQLSANWGDEVEKWFFTFVIIQAYIIRANEIEDALKETVANNRISFKFLQTEEKKFDQREWEYLQLNWTLNHKLIYLDSRNRSFYESLRRAVGIDDIQQSIDAQSNMIRSWYTHSFQSVTKNFIQVGATLGIITGLLGINVSGLTSDITGIPYGWWWTMVAIMSCIYAWLIYRTLFANPLGKSIRLFNRNKGNQGPPWG